METTKYDQVFYEAEANALHPEGGELKCIAFNVVKK